MGEQLINASPLSPWCAEAWKHVEGILYKRSSPDESRELHKLNLCGERSIIPLFLLHHSPDVIRRQLSFFLFPIINRSCLIDFRGKLQGKVRWQVPKSKKSGKWDHENIIFRLGFRCYVWQAPMGRVNMKRMLIRCFPSSIWQGKLLHCINALDLYACSRLIGLIAVYIQN